MPAEETFEVTNHRFYENKFPEVDDVVMVKVTQITDIGIYVNLLEYNDIQGFIPASELSRRRIRSIPKLVQVGKVEPSMVTRVDKVKGYIDLSKRRVADDDMKEAEKRYKEAKKVHNIAGILSNRCKINIDTVYETIIWPLSAKYQSAYNAFLLSVSNPEILNDLSVDPSVIAELVSLINARMSPQAKKVRSDIEVTCFSIHGVDGIRAAMAAAEAVGTSEMPVTITLIASPLYVMTTTAMQDKDGIELLTKAIAELERVIKEYEGNLVVKIPPRVAQRQEDADLEGLMKKMEMENQEVAADDDDSDD